ncbi:S-layer homology domain-containing protein [Fictibacillus nanhaiensis]|uniref:S-layer homology domain-containing protein n=1 Tax=Fictibacillus nanhaiensis TaxID=742169 RepID=UPI00203AD26F|nr:S-layer homology domain-containing protein [Fictibacillus nanhaiensis]MCM3734149.1 S-layer homology domain-containing protein [Fictibacillus nanhaiensis]
MKKFLFLFVLPFLLLFSLGMQTAAANDGLDNEQFRDEMRRLIELGILKGVEVNGRIDYMPKENVTRAQFATFMIRTLGEEDLKVDAPKNFSDVKVKDWFYVEVQQAAQLGIVNGRTDGTFDPNGTVTREEIAKMISKAFEYKGITLPQKDISTYKDVNKVSDYAKVPIAQMTGAGILNGYNNFLDPKGKSTRGMTAAFLVRMLDVLKKHEEPAEPKFFVGTATPDQTVKGKEYPSFADAKAAATGANDVVLKDDKIVYMKKGQVTNSSLSAMVDIDDQAGYNLIGLESGTAAEYIESDENVVKVKFGTKTGFIKMEKAHLIPEVQIKGQSYYEVEGEYLYHHTFNSRTNSYYAPYKYGKSDSDMPDGEYYSDNGSLYTSKADGKTYTAYQYFNMMPLYTKTSYTAEELNQFVKEHKPDGIGTSVLETMGEKFKAIEKEHNINAMYLLAHAIHESKWGTNEKAIARKNLFGIGAQDGTDGLTTFDSYDACLDSLVYNLIKKKEDNYFLESSYRYNGAFLGNKDLGMNVFYATDPYWGQKIAGFMNQIDEELGGKERNKYDIAVTLVKGFTTKVRSTPSVANNLLYELTKTGTPVLVLDTVQTEKEGTWLEVVPKNLNGADYPKAYIYSHGGPAAYGTKNMEILELAE